eukprot:TRINITY_DN962_c0_g1_i8.p5 TRINITY_DN962_c0_g1~~TRINITY_DN962_c0_g1_i8.p5  ORF type:complete len:109 (-),score=2.19 TRINITY_DN962_c0_g1_i8:220-546(-)
MNATVILQKKNQNGLKLFINATVYLCPLSILFQNYDEFLQHASLYDPKIYIIQLQRCTDLRGSHHYNVLFAFCHFFFKITMNSTNIKKQMLLLIRAKLTTGFSRNQAS